MQPRQVLMHTAAVTGGRCTAGRTVIATDGGEPVFARPLLLVQDRGGEGEILVRVQQIAGVLDAVCVIAGIDLAQANIDAPGRHFQQ